MKKLIVILLMIGNIFIFGNDVKVEKYSETSKEIKNFYINKYNIDCGFIKIKADVYLDGDGKRFPGYRLNTVIVYQFEGSDTPGTVTEYEEPPTIEKPREVLVYPASVSCIFLKNNDGVLEVYFVNGGNGKGAVEKYKYFYLDRDKFNTEIYDTDIKKLIKDKNISLNYFNQQEKKAFEKQIFLTSRKLK